MESLSINIKIADREYPMKVSPEDEARLRSAGKLLNEHLKRYSNQFGIDDKQDLLAMAAFDALVEKITLEEERRREKQHAVHLLDELSDMISNVA